MELKDEFPLTRDRIWFNTAATGACPSSTIATIEAYMADVLSGLLEEGYELQTPVEEDRRIYVNFKVPGFKEVGRSSSHRGSR